MRLADAVGGVWEVTAAGTRYLVDLGRRRLKIADPTHCARSAVGEWLLLGKLIQCYVGLPLLVVCRGAGEEAPRQCGLVSQIREVRGGAGSPEA
ncbi:hypothetical protein [Nocardioides sp. P86]|uniref:hypothetical protein n=1 Tax=Nocardioides sp. P86 TaxID=2939569 RepID=UPI0020408CDD|nr:hypothetical protein [Nocardioides sp. P86]MCM3516242.1 hypothetical protein [Nocardioides sp. P86]